MNEAIYVKLQHFFKLQHFIRDIKIYILNYFNSNSRKCIEKFCVDLKSSCRHTNLFSVESRIALSTCMQDSEFFNLRKNGQRSVNL